MMQWSILLYVMIWAGGGGGREGGLGVGFLASDAA
jgi:hypothetical protein